MQEIDFEEKLKLSKNSLEQRKRLFPIELLGRSLSANPFLPRDIQSYLKENCSEIISLEIDNNDEDILNIISKYAEEKNSLFSIETYKDIEVISLLRRYIQTPIILDSFIYDIYQLVEALVFGADAVVLVAKILSQEDLKELSSYARHLGLEVLIEINNKEELTKAIKCGVDILVINQKDIETQNIDTKLCENLISLIPNNKIIITKNHQNKNIEELNQIGIDTFFKI